ncbi:Nn.00g113570.m01.CDS01 [Neocucurbitaria sp. VM-36]
MISLYGRNPLQQLIGSSDQMLKFVKAWHLGDMLDLIVLQNEIVDTFSTFYEKLLRDRVRMPLCHEPFEYLRDHIGNHTKAEIFLIDFYAGLARYGGLFRAEELRQIPKDICQTLRQRRVYFAALDSYRDSIIRGHGRYKVNMWDETQRTFLHILPPPRPRTEFLSDASFLRPPCRRAFSLSTLTSILFPPSPTPPNSPTQPLPQTTCRRSYQVSRSLPIMTNMNERLEALSERVLVPIWHVIHGNKSHSTAPSSSFTQTTRSERPPCIDKRPYQPYTQTQRKTDDELSDQEPPHDDWSNQQTSREHTLHHNTFREGSSVTVTLARASLNNRTPDEEYIYNVWH